MNRFPNVNVASELVKLAQARYRVLQSHEGEFYAVRNSGAHVALPIHGSAFHSQLARAFREECGVVPHSAAIKDAVRDLEGSAQDTPREALPFRVAGEGEAIVVDLADAAGRAVLVDRLGWEVLDRSSVPFRHSELTWAHPVPERGGNLNSLRELFNADDDAMALILAWLVASYLPNIDHPILLLRGAAGAAKTTAARRLVALSDPSAAPVKSPPTKLEQWYDTASGSWVVAVDNVTDIPDWLCNAMCRASTGDGEVRRRKYTDNDRQVIAMRRPVILTAINPPLTRDDFGQRVLLADLEPFKRGEHKSESVLARQFEEMRPKIFGAVLDAVSTVLGWMESSPAGVSRLADFGRVLEALDRSGITRNAVASYQRQRQRFAEEVAESSPLAGSMIEFAKAKRSWCGTASQLVQYVCNSSGRQELRRFQAMPNQFMRRLKELYPTLTELGVHVSTAKTGGQRVVTIEHRPTAGECAERTVETPPDEPLD